ncbi:MAG: ABC transporter permease [Actinobacteria bacterium]|nr:ABC transporter permease [Actinomycetota bacterium]MBU1494831.1 ABC transporter permease [Actinomycetota bacterium]
MRLQYLFGQAMHNLRRNALVVVSAVLAVWVTMTMVYAAVVMRQVVNDNTAYWDEGIRVIAFLTDDLSFDEIEALRLEIEQWDEVDTVTYFSKSQALDEFREIFADQPSLIEVVEEDPSTLPASLRVKPAEAADYGFITDRLGVIAGVRQVESADQYIDQLVMVSGLLQAGAVIFAVFLGSAAVVLIANTIRMAIYARRDEIGIMKLVGAGNWFVRIPFLVEGMFEGFVGSLLAVAPVWLLFAQIAPRFQDTDSLITISIEPLFMAQWGIVMVVFGVAAGFFGSAIGMWGFLRD